MDPYIAEWLNLILRFAHVVTGVAWIGASFYFIWLDNHLVEPPAWKKEKGIKGDLWAIHGGGFYEVAKYQLAPPAMPDHLHWFKWEAYSTWITGFFLLALMYYVGAEIYLIDPNVANLSQWQAIAIGLLVIFGGWFVYNFLCDSVLSKNSTTLGIILIVLVTTLAYVLTELFSARGAFIHVGAVIGTIMAGNVFRIIIPGQKALVAAVEAGEKPDPIWAQKAKLRSTHNTYTTLPLLFIMISNHYPMTYNHPYNWAVLMVIIGITAAVRQYFVARHFNKQRTIVLIVAAIATIALAYFIAPSPQKNETTAVVSDQVALGIVQARCSTCHSTSPTDDVFLTAPGGIVLDTLEDIVRYAPRIKARSIDATDMPLMNKTQMTAEERSLLAQWISNGDDR